MEEKVKVTLVLALTIILISSVLIMLGESSTGFATKKNSCTDSDGGKTYDKYGFVTYNGNPNFKDGCTALAKNTLTEYYCDSSKMVRFVSYKCPNGCSNGACVKKVVSTTPGKSFVFTCTGSTCCWPDDPNYQNCVTNNVNIGTSPVTVYNLVPAQGFSMNNPMYTIPSYGESPGAPEGSVCTETMCFRSQSEKDSFDEEQKKQKDKPKEGSSDFSFMPSNTLVSGISRSGIQSVTTNRRIATISRSDKYRKSTFICYDKSKTEKSSTTCQTSEGWKNSAQTFCKGHCNNLGQCGIKILKVWNKC
jgi:hypothetical protein